MTMYDVVVIGAGPGGYVSAIKASQLGLKTAIVDKEWLGGVCLNVGCIPSKSLLRNAEVAELLQKKGREFGFAFDNLTLDYSHAVKRSRKVSNRLTKGVAFLMKKNKIDVFMGKAELTSPNDVTVLDSEGNSTQITSKNFILATGAKPIVPTSWEVDGEQVLTYREAILQEKLPESVVIIGAGAVGIEFATIWSSYGVDVSIVELLSTLLPLEDPEIGRELEKAYIKRKIKIYTGHKVEQITKSETGVTVHISGPESSENELKAEQALVAIGFLPNTNGLGLEKIGVELGNKGEILIDSRMATNVPSIWAIGDVTAKLMLAHTASTQGIICAENIAGVDTVELDYEMIPRATYSHPQVASFGLTEDDARQRGHEVKVGRFPFQANGKALGIGDSTGWVKIITDAKYGEILGAHMIGPEVTELLPELTLAQMMELTAEQIARNIHAHPSLSEVLMEAAHAVDGSPIHI